VSEIKKSAKREKSEVSHHLRVRKRMWGNGMVDRETTKCARLKGGATIGVTTRKELVVQCWPRVKELMTKARRKGSRKVSSKKWPQT